jgi:hypothetical protein
MDRDGKGISDKLNDTKKRIQNELGNDNIWVTKGREIENYLTKSSIEKWLLNNYKINSEFSNDANKKIEDSILEIEKARKIIYNQNKNRYAIEIVNQITFEDMKILDLYENVQKVVEIINNWNKK